MVAVGKSSAFLGWSAHVGIQTPLDLVHRADGARCMTCTENVAAGEDLLRVPLGACITADTLESLAERLAYEKEKGRESEYAPYIEVLPTLEDAHLLSLPRFWDAGRLDKVVDGGQLEARMKNDERKDIDPWALACVDSRANFLGESYSMTPVLDMINHDGSVPTRASVTEDEAGVLCLSVDRSFDRGEEAFISYGNLSNLDTLADYGFVAENNPCNSESVGVRMMRRPPLSVTVHADGSVDSGAKAALRYYLASEEELEMFPANGSGLGILTKPISERNEIDVQSFLASTLSEAAYDAKCGASEARNDRLVSLYLTERARLFDQGVERIKSRYPDLEY